jgi:cation:H+ antiporter
MLFVGLGTTLPELFFSIRAVKNNHESLAMGDILGTVITDATIVVGILALINPFFFSQRIVYVTGMFMVVAAVMLLYLMRTGKVLTKKEGLFLLFYYLIFVLIEFTINNYFKGAL